MTYLKFSFVFDADNINYKSQTLNEMKFKTSITILTKNDLILFSGWWIKTFIG